MRMRNKKATDLIVDGFFNLGILPASMYWKGTDLPFICLTNEWWRQADSNRWPSACKADALPTELCPQKISFSGSYSYLHQTFMGLHQAS